MWKSDFKLILLIFNDNRKFKAQLDFLEAAHSKGNYLPWEPTKDCTTYVILDSDPLDVLYNTNKHLYGRIKEQLFALAQEAEFQISFCRLTRDIQIRRYLNGKPKGKPQAKVVHFKTFVDLFRMMRICTYENYITNIINK